MPTVPGLTPSVSPSDTPTPSVRTSATPAAFGGVVGQALEHLGAGVEQASDKIWTQAVALQQLRNESEAREADAQYIMQSGKLQADFKTLQGKDAVDAFPKYRENLNSLRQGIRGSLTTDQSRKMYDSSALGFMAREIFNAAGHAATQNKQYAAGSATALIKQYQDDAAHNPTDDDSFERNVARTQNQVHTVLAPIHGWDDEQAKVASKTAVSGMWAHRITGLTHTAPASAEAMFEANKDKLFGDDLFRTENTVRNQQRITGSRVVADSYLDPFRQPQEEGAKVPSEQELVDKALKDPRVVNSNDPLLKDYVRNQVMSGYRQFRQAQKEQTQANTDTLWDAVTSGKATDLTTLQHASPASGAAFDSLSKTEQAKWPARINNYIAAANKTTNAKNLNYLRGLADEHPEEFVNEDLTKYQLGQKDLGQLLQLQRKKAKTPEQDPKVVSAMRTLMPMIPEEVRQNKETMLQLRGAMQLQLEQSMLESKKMPTPEEVRKIGANLLAEQADPEKWSWGFLNRKSRTFELEIPEEAQKAINADYAAKFDGRLPTPEESRQLYVRERYKELFPSKKKTKPAPGTEE